MAVLTVRLAARGPEADPGLRGHGSEASARTPRGATPSGRPWSRPGPAKPRPPQAPPPALGPAAAGSRPSRQPRLPCLGTVRSPRSRHSPAVGPSRPRSRVLPAVGTHSMIFRCFVSQSFSMENQGDRAMIATGNFEERDTFREA